MKAIILFSGGLDSTVVLAMALANKRECIALSFDYGQKHRVELQAAKTIAAYYQVPHQILTIDPSAFGHSSLVSHRPVPKDRTLAQRNSGEIPNTYVPARNVLFLAFALGQAELHQAQEIHAGPNALDAIPYVDCRPAFYEAFQKVAHLATQQAAEGKGPTILTPLIYWNKKQIVETGLALKAPLHLSFSCYDPDPKGAACSRCDACLIREQAFAEV